MIFSGAGVWHSPNNIQLMWGANFGPATQDGEWWRLATAMFLHFGLFHLLVNVVSLWDAGHLVERMYGHVRFISIYFMSGLFGNLVSLVVQGNLAVSGGASGAIFGIYGALLVFLWRNRIAIAHHEFRWLFWGALVFACLTIALGFIVPGIDNSAHIGGFLSGILLSHVFARPYLHKDIPLFTRLSAGITIIIAVMVLIMNIPAPKYLWSDELLLRKEIDHFLEQDQSINRSWLDIANEKNKGEMTFDELANKIDSNIVDPYEESFEKLSQLPNNKALPSANKLNQLLQYLQNRKGASEAAAANLRKQ